VERYIVRKNQYSEIKKQKALN